MEDLLGVGAAARGAACRGVCTCTCWLWHFAETMQEYGSHPASPNCSLGEQIRRLNVSVALSSLFGDLNFISQFQASHVH